FDLSEEQVALQQVAREFLAERWPADRMRAALDAMPATIDDDVWKEIVSMGWLGVAAPEDVGGIEGDFVTAAVLAEEAGRGLLPGPFQSSLIAAIAVERSQDAGAREELLGPILDGRLHVTIALDEPAGEWGPDAVSLVATQRGDEFTLSGTKILVPDAASADMLLVAARTPHGPGLLRVPADAAGVSIEPMRRLDAQAISEVVFDAVSVPEAALLGGASNAESTLCQVWDVWVLLAAADLLGVAGASLETTAGYVSERIQFGRPIGTFQAVSHRLADCAVDVEIGRSLVYAAGLALDEGRDNASALASAAKAWLGDAAVAASESALQLHGGVGFTWEYDVHLYLRRARSGAATLGDADFHRDRVASYMEREGVHSAREPRS
ncbi:MAG: acyl-CoA dehydrogenase, partial [Deltaproteobacteria bacterium]|nr:acyl-CoA dehydrogenase [Deltaproteobacteria bacterium]